METQVETRADRLRRARLAAGYSTIVAACTAFGWSEDTYRMHENPKKRGGRVPDAAAERYASAYHVAPEWLLYGRGQGPGGQGVASSDHAAAAAASLAQSGSDSANSSNGAYLEEDLMRLAIQEALDAYRTSGKLGSVEPDRFADSILRGYRAYLSARRLMRADMD